MNYVTELLVKQEFEDINLVMDNFNVERHYSTCKAFYKWDSEENYGVECGIDIEGKPANVSHYFKGEDNWGYVDLEAYLDRFLSKNKFIEKEMVERFDFYVYLPPERINKEKNYYGWYKGKTVHEFRIWLNKDYYVTGLDSIESEHSKISRLDEHSFKIEVFDQNYTYLDFDDNWLKDNGWI